MSRRYQVPVMVTFTAKEGIDSAEVAELIHEFVMATGVGVDPDERIQVVSIDHAPADPNDPNSPPVPAEDLDPWWKTIGHDGQEA
jgi:hypothetical protein